MGNRDFTYKIATFVIQQLHEKGRCIRTDDIKNWMSNKYRSEMPETDERAFGMYEKSVFALLDTDLGLIEMEDKVIHLTEKGKSVASKFDSVKDYIFSIERNKKWNDRFDFANKVIPIASFVFGLASNLYGFIVEQIAAINIGWTLLGIAIGFSIRILKK